MIHPFRFYSDNELLTTCLTFFDLVGIQIEIIERYIYIN
jgi:hypothetical protein